MEKKEFKDVPEEVKSRIVSTINLNFDEILLFRSIPDTLREASKILDSYGECVPSGALLGISNFLDYIRRKDFIDVFNNDVIARYDEEKHCITFISDDNGQD